MKLCQYSLYDRDLESFTTPVFDYHLPDDELVLLKRSIKSQQFDPRGKVLYLVGMFDDQTGKVIPDFKLLANCEELLPPGELAKLFPPTQVVPNTNEVQDDGQN